jgi:hypothetical protein
MKQTPRCFQAQGTFERTQGRNRKMRLGLARSSLPPGRTLPETGLARLELGALLCRRLLQHVFEQRLPSMVMDHERKIMHQRRCCPQRFDLCRRQSQN